MPGLDKDQRQFSNTPEYKYQDQLMPIPLMQNTGQQPTKEVLCDELEGYYSSTKTINQCQQVLTPDRHPFHKLPQPCGGIKCLCTVLISTTYNLIS